MSLSEKALGMADSVTADADLGNGFPGNWELVILILWAWWGSSLELHSSIPETLWASGCVTLDHLQGLLTVTLLVPALSPLALKSLSSQRPGPRDGQL